MPGLLSEVKPRLKPVLEFLELELVHACAFQNTAKIDLVPHLQQLFAPRVRLCPCNQYISMACFSAAIIDYLLILLVKTILRLI